MVVMMMRIMIGALPYHAHPFHLSYGEHENNYYGDDDEPSIASDLIVQVATNFFVIAIFHYYYCLCLCLSIAVFVFVIIISISMTIFHHDDHHQVCKSDFEVFEALACDSFTLKVSVEVVVLVLLSLVVVYWSYPIEYIVQ